MTEELDPEKFVDALSLLWGGIRELNELSIDDVSQAELKALHAQWTAMTNATFLSSVIVNILAEALTVLCQPRVWVVSATRDGEPVVIKERDYADAVGWVEYWSCSCTNVRLTWRTLRGEVR